MRENFPAGGLRTPALTTRGRWWISAPFVVVVALYVLPLAGSPPATNPNEVARIELAAALATNAGVDIESAAWVYGLSEDVARRDGHIYSDKAPGLSFLAAPIVLVVDALLPSEPGSDLPVYWPLRHLLTLLLVALPTAALAFLIATCVPEGGPLRAPAMVAALATPLWTYATVFFGHATAAVLVTIAWVLLLRPGSADRPPHRLAAVAGGVAAGFAVTVEYPTALLVGVVFAALAARRTPLTTLGWAVAGALIGLLPALAYHQLAFGAPWLTGYAFKAQSQFQAIHAHGLLGVSWPSLEALWGVLFSARRGLFYFSPVLLLAPLGLWRMARGSGLRDVGPLAAGITLYVLFAAGFVDWEAGWCAAARHLVPVVPLLAIPALDALVNFDGGWLWKVVAAVLVALSGVNAALSIALTPFFPPQFDVPLAQLVLPSLADGAGLHNIISAAIGVPVIAVVISIVVITVATLGWASSRVLRMPRRWVAAVFAATLAAQLLWLGWQGAGASADVELMRAQVLRRLGEGEVADRIESSVISTTTSSRD